MIDNAHRSNASTSSDITVPLGYLAAFEHESPRWPPTLDHAAIVARLVGIRESGPAYRGGLAELIPLFDDVERMPSVQIANCVFKALTWTQDNPGYGFLAKQLQIVAMNLKNLA